MKQYKNLIYDKNLDKILSNTMDLALRRRAKYLVKSLKIKQKEKIIEIGCGNGFYLNILQNLKINNTLVGLDPDKQAIKDAKKYLKNDKIELLIADITKKTKFKNNSFDKCITSEVIEHLSQDVLGLKEINRILKKGGTLVLSVPNSHYPFLWDPINKTLELFFGTHIKSGFWAGIWNQHTRLYTKEQLEKVLAKSGFQVKEIKPTTYWCLPFNHYIINLGARILASNINMPSLTKGADKFKSGERKAFLPLIYSKISNTIDKLNDHFPGRKYGVSLVAVAIKK